LALALHHSKIAEDKALREEAEEKEALNVLFNNKFDLTKLREFIELSTTQEPRSPFRRVPIEAFKQILYYSDSPSLVSCSASCSKCRDSIVADPSLFRRFEMKGKREDPQKGIRLFGQENGNSIQRMDLSVTDEPDPQTLLRLRDAILRSKETLETFSISHHGVLSGLIADAAAECPDLLLLSSTRAGREDEILIPEANDIHLEFPASWSASLHTLIWADGASNLVFNQPLLANLGKAKDIRIGSQEISCRFLVKLLATTPSLVNVVMPHAKNWTHH